MIDALHCLPFRERECLVLQVMADLSVAEVSAELSVPEGSVKSWLWRERTQLASELGLRYHDNEEEVTT